MPRAGWWTLLVVSVGCGAPRAPVSATKTASAASSSCGPVTASDCSANAAPYERIAPIVQAQCLRCHDGKGEAGPENDFSTAGRIAVHRAGIAARVSRCIMPPEGAPQPSAAERALLVTWASCRQ